MELNITLFNEIDWIYLATVLCLLVWGMARGIGRVSASLVLWLLVLTISQIIAGFLAKPLGAYISDPELLLLLPFILIFIFLFTLGRVIFSLLMLSHKNITTPLTRLFGGLFSIPLVAIQSIFVIQLARLLTFDNSVYWMEAEIIPYIEKLDTFWNAWVISELCQNLSGSNCFF